MPGHLPRGVVPMLVLSSVVVLVVVGLARGLWLANLHNGLLALAFTGVGAYVLFQRPRHREGLLFVATGVVEALMFLARQIGHASSEGSSWWARLGEWPIALGVGLATLSVILFPDGRLPSPAWRWVVVAVVVVSGLCTVIAALWSADHDATVVTHSAYATFQVLWVVAVVQRWRSAREGVRPQLAVLLAATTVTVAALLVGLAGWDSPRAGLLTTALVPLAAGWAIVHGQHVAAYSALSWLSRAEPRQPDDLPTSVARAVSEALSAPVVLWLGREERLFPIGVWPDVGEELSATTAAALTANARLVRAVSRDGDAQGFLSVDRAEPLSRSEERLLGDLSAQATLVVEHVTLGELVARQRREGHLDGLSPRENDVLQLMAQGRSNAAICAELHLSVKTVEPVVSTIFAKLGLHADSASNRRVLAVLAYLQS